MRALFGGLLIVVRRFRYTFAWFVLCMVLPAVLGALSGCAAVEEPDHWRDAVKSGKGLLRGS